MGIAFMGTYMVLMLSLPLGTRYLVAGYYIRTHRWARYILDPVLSVPQEVVLRLLLL